MTSRVTMPAEWFGVISTSVIFFMMAGNALSSPYGLALNDCEEDHECAENMFCYNMRTCVKCTNCTVYYRKPNPRKMCAREPSECGECLDGHEADVLTNGNERDYCRFVGKSTIEQIPGTAPSINSTMLIVGACIVIVTAALAGFIIHRWRKMRYRGGDQAAQNVQESHHAGSGNGMSPLLGNVNERKPSFGEQTSCIRPSAPPPPAYESSVPHLRDEATLERKLSLGEQTSCIRPSAPSQPPPYESSVPPLRDEATRVIERMVKCHEAVCFREPAFDISSFPVEDPDDESNDGSDIDVGSNPDPDINAESGYPIAFHDDDTMPASADGNDQTVEQSAMNFQSSAEGPSFLGVFRNAEINNSDMNDSGLSQDSLSSLSDESETVHEDGCRPEHHAVKRSGWPREDEGTTLDASDATSDGMLRCTAVPNTDHEAQQAGASSMSQASSSVSLTSNTAGPHCVSEGPVAKRQKFDSGNSSTAEDLQEDEETCRSHEHPRINVQAITVLNVQNVINYNIPNTNNAP